MNIETIGVREFRKAFASLFPSRPQPASDDEAEVMLHYARLASRTVSEPAKDMSALWLRKHGFIVEGVGVAVIARSADRKDIAAAKEAAMARIAGDMVTDGVRDSDSIRAEMRHAAALVKEW